MGRPLSDVAGRVVVLGRERDKSPGIRIGVAHRWSAHRSGTRRCPAHERGGRVGRRSGPEPTGDPLGVCVASGGPGVSRPRLRPHEWIAVGVTPFACCRTPRRAVTAVGQRAAVTDAVRQPATGCASSVGPHHRHTPGGITAPRARRDTPRRRSPPPRWQPAAVGGDRRPHRQPGALTTSTGNPHRAPRVRSHVLRGALW